MVVQWERDSQQEALIKQGTNLNFNKKQRMTLHHFSEKVFIEIGHFYPALGWGPHWRWLPWASSACMFYIGFTPRMKERKFIIFHKLDLVNHRLCIQIPKCTTDSTQPSTHQWVTIWGAGLSLVSRQQSSWLHSWTGHLHLSHQDEAKDGYRAPGFIHMQHG